MSLNEHFNPGMDVSFRVERESQRVMGRRGKYGHYSSILARMEYEYLIQTELNMV